MRSRDTPVGKNTSPTSRPTSSQAQPRSDGERENQVVPELGRGYRKQSTLLVAGQGLGTEVRHASMFIAGAGPVPFRIAWLSTFYRPKPGDVGLLRVGNDSAS
jgi:hypothetical protein